MKRSAAPPADDLVNPRGLDGNAERSWWVRADQHVAQVLPPDSHDEPADFLRGFVVEP